GTTRTQISNLYLAGDFCQTPIDLVSMESAVCSGLAAAEALRLDLGTGTSIPVLTPDTYPRGLFVLGKIVLLPAAAIAKLWTCVSGPDFNAAASDVPPFRLQALPKWPVVVIEESLMENNNGLTSA